MSRIIVTDSTSYLDEGYRQDKHIRVVPLNVDFNGQSFKEGEHFSNREYYQLMRAEPVFPTTSQPAAGDFLKVFESLTGEDEALVLLISSQISGTVGSARLAREMAGDKLSSIHIVDTNLTAAPLLMVVKLAQKRLDAGWPIDQILEEIDDVSQQMKTYFVVDNLEYLVRGGRLGHWARVLANTLKLKPVLELRGGRIELYQKIRTKHNAINHIFDMLAADLPAVKHLGLMHVDSEDEVRLLESRIREIYNGELFVQEVGPVVGSHAGPGTIGMAWY